ncbi:hypothetical protein GPY57_10535 [Photorhabdus laumondii subsp. laumondii]|nr:hypothetical protein [Photorhabdus laumondii subsp. laumondii]
MSTPSGERVGLICPDSGAIFPVISQSVYFSNLGLSGSCDNCQQMRATLASTFVSFITIA